jgi:protein SCO1/2
MRKKVLTSLALSLVVGVAYATSAIAITSQPAAGGGVYLGVPVPSSVLAIPLFGTTGNKFTLGDYKGKYVVLSDFLTSCQEICPMTTVNMRQIGDSLNASQLKGKAISLEVSVDPYRDTAARIKAYQAVYASNSFTLASGSSKSLSDFWKFFGVAFMKSPYSAADLKKIPVDWQTGKKNTFDISHTDAVMIITPDQKWGWLDLGNPNIGKAAIPAKMKAFLDSQGQSNLVKPEQPDWAPEAVYSALTYLSKTKIGA